MFQLAGGKLLEIMDSDYFGEDEDKRMGLAELDEDYEDWD